MPSSPQSDEREPTRLFKTRILFTALGDKKRFDARAGVIFDKNELLLSSPRDFVIPHEIRELIRAPDHPQRIQVCDGPLIFRETARVEEPSVIPVQTFLLAPDAEVRDAALAHFQRLRDRAPFGVKRPTKKALDDLRADLLSEDSGTWRSAALRAYDILDDDYLLALAGCRQALTAKFEQGVKDYLDRVLRPTASAVEGIELEVQKPSEAHETLQRIVEECASQGSLAEACEQYFHRLGYVPLSPQWSLGAVVGLWLSRNPGQGSPSDVSEWAKGTGSVLPIIHETLLLVKHPELLAEDKEPRLMELVSAFLGGQSPLVTNEMHAEHTMLGALGKHFTCHLAVSFPWSDGEKLVVHSLWMAWTLTEMFRLSEYPTDEILRVTIRPTLENSHFMWFATRPPSDPTSMKLPILMEVSPWAYAVAAGLHNVAARVGRHGKADARAAVAKWLSRHLVTVAPKEAPAQAEQTFGVDEPLDTTARLWAEQLNDQPALAEQLDAFVSMNKQLATQSATIELFEKLPSRSEADRAVVLSAMKVIAYRSNDLAKEVWPILGQRKWARQLLSSVELPVLDLLLDLLIEVQSTAGNHEITFGLPHIIATSTEAADDDERRSLLATGVVLSCICACKASAIDRLCSGGLKDSLMHDLRRWRDQLKAAAREAPPWAAGRMRRVLSRLP